MLEVELKRTCFTSLFNKQASPKWESCTYYPIQSPWPAPDADTNTAISDTHFVSTLFNHLAHVSRLLGLNMLPKPQIST